MCSVEIFLGGSHFFALCFRYGVIALVGFMVVEYFNQGLSKSGQLSMRKAGRRSLAPLSLQLGWSSSAFAAWEAKCPPHQLSRLPEP